MPAYVIADVHVTDLERYPEYVRQVPGTLEPFGGRFIARGGQTDVREGEWNDRVVIIEFPSLEAARGWYESETYQRILPIRLANSEGRIVIVDGL
jgi:uncharacterized protein (DUF1330 family)